VAAPTAGLHFTEGLLAALTARGNHDPQDDASCRGRGPSSRSRPPTPKGIACMPSMAA
jgi:hypothetical protein